MYCGICGDEKTHDKPVRYWSPDNGWKIGHLCESCSKQFGRATPLPMDFAWDKRNGMPDDSGTDLDATEAL